MNKYEIEELYKYGERSEKDLYDIIKQYRNDFILTDRYNHFDFIAEDDEKIYLIELKTRTLYKDTFKYTFFPLSKINYYKNFKKLHPDKKCVLIACFGFLVKNAKKCEYYAIQYNPSIFNKYKLTPNDYNEDKNINVNIEDLKPIEYFLNLLKK